MSNKLKHFCPNIKLWPNISWSLLNNDHEIFGHNFIFGQKCFCCLLLSFFRIKFLKKSYRNSINMSNCLDADQNECSVSPNLGPNCLQKLSVDNKSYPYKGKIPNIGLKIVHLRRYIVGIMDIYWKDQLLSPRFFKKASGILQSPPSVRLSVLLSVRHAISS